MGHRLHDEAQELSGGLHRGGPHVRIRHAVQGQTRAQVRKEADEILDQFNNVCKSPEQKMPRESSTRSSYGRKGQSGSDISSRALSHHLQGDLEEAKADAGDFGVHPVC